MSGTCECRTVVNQCLKGWLKWVKKVTWSHSADSGHWQCVNSSNFSSEFLM